MIKMQDNDQYWAMVNVSCIIPFYNEGERIFSVLEAITQIKDAQVICIDDGSTDGTSAIITKNWPQVELIRLPKNQGKASAIGHGLSRVTHEMVLLMDADLQNVDISELEDAILSFAKHSSIDMLILRRINAAWFVKMDRFDILLSGERIMRKHDLVAILSHNVSGYQVEIAINEYMHQHKKNVRWLPWSAVNTYKMQKQGVWSGLVNELVMFSGLLYYCGLPVLFRQVVLFGRKKFENAQQPVYVND